MRLLGNCGADNVAGKHAACIKLSSGIVLDHSDFLFTFSNVKPL